MPSPTIADLAKARVIVLGDAMTDKWVYGTIDRLNPEGADIPLMKIDRTEIRPGGAANVRENIEALGAYCWTPLRPPLWQWPLKTRYVINGRHMLRVDDERQQELSGPQQTMILASLPDADVLVLSDYAKGYLAGDFPQACIQWAKAKGMKVVVDPKSDDWTKYGGCDVICPNREEFMSLRGYQGSPLYKIVAVLVTCGEQGMLLRELGKPEVLIPGHHAAVKDVAGCGDTVVAVVAAALAIGADLETAARWANAAASVVVGKEGTATCSLSELEKRMHPLYMVQGEVVTVLPKIRGARPIVGFCNGVFDQLHEGHKAFLREAWSRCDKLVVAIDTDERVRKHKGPGRPRDYLDKRISALYKTGYMDHARWFSDDAGLLQHIADLRPDVIFKSDEYRNDPQWKDDPRVQWIPRTPDVSTTGGGK